MKLYSLLTQPLPKFTGAVSLVATLIVLPLQANSSVPEKQLPGPLEEVVVTPDPSQLPFLCTDYDTNGGWAAQDYGASICELFKEKPAQETPSVRPPYRSPVSSDSVASTG